MRTYQQATRKLLFTHYDGLINNAMDSAQPLFKLRQHLPAARAFNTSDIEFARVATDASDCCPGDLYIAIVTGDGDGHNDIELAIANGAVGILAERLLPTTSPLFIVDDTRTAFSELNQVLFGDFDDSLITIAVTGSTGISATSRLISHMLGTRQQACPIVTTPANCTPQQAFEIQARKLKELAVSNEQFVIQEVTTDQLASRFFDTFSFDFLVITSVEIAPVEFDGTAQAYANSYDRAFQQLEQHGVAVLNFADPVTRFEFIPEDRAFLSIGTNDESDIWAQHLEHGRFGQRFIIHAGELSAEVFSPILGNQHVISCLQTIAIGLLLELPFDQLCRSITSYDQAPGHLQRIDRGQGFDVFVDHANSARDLNKAVLSLRQISQGRLIVVYGPSAEHTADQRAAMGSIAEKFADVSIITENNPEYEDPLAIAHDVLDGYLRSADAYVVPGRERAIVFGLTMAEEGDTVLIAGKGDKAFDKVGAETYYFDDVEIASVCLDEILNPVAKYGRDIFRFEDYTDG